MEPFVEVVVGGPVESEWLIKAGVGQEYKPDDYLQLFTRFVAEHEREIAAVQILLTRPGGER